MIEVVDIYARISKDQSGEGLGVERQVEDCRAFATKQGWTVRRVLVDNDVSAYSGKRRPQYEELLKDVEEGLVTRVLAWDPDRLHRSPKELERYIDLTTEAKVQTHTINTGEWDLSTPAGLLRSRMFGVIARYESDHKSERIKRAKRQAAESGGRMGGPRPFGFEEDLTILREEEAQELRKAAEALLSGVSLRGYAKELNARGIPTTAGTLTWSAPRLRSILLKPRVAGLTCVDGEPGGPAPWPAILDIATWEALRALLTDPARNTVSAERGRSRRWLGSGLYFCGGCGRQVMRGTAAKSLRPAVPMYRCGKSKYLKETGVRHVSRGAVPVDEYVEEAIVRRLSDRGELRDLVAAHKCPPGMDVAGLSAELASCKGRKLRLVELFSAGVIGEEQLSHGTRLADQRVQEISCELAGLERRSPLEPLLGVDDVRAHWFGVLPDRSDGMSLARRRAILDALMEVRLMPAKKGPGFDPMSVEISWKM